MPRCMCVFVYVCLCIYVYVQAHTHDTRIYVSSIFWKKLILLPNRILFPSDNC